MFNNISHVTNFRLDVADNDGTKVFQSAVQSATIPSITISPTEINVQGSVNQAAGAAFQFDPLNVKILVDEDLNSYLEIFKWMISIIDYRNLKSYSQFSGNLPKTVFVHILDNSKKNIVVTYKFNNAWPSVLGELNYEYTDETNTPMNCIVTFMYSTFDILDQSGNMIQSYGSDGRINSSMIPTNLSLHPSIR